MILSVIIPVYKTEQTLNRCIESILCQCSDDMEIILVDDGSPDRCPHMCDEWSKKDNRVIVIHKENGGLSDARNAGLDIAKGEYVTFVDSDDYLNDGIYDKMLAILFKMPSIDIIEFSINCIGWKKIDILYSDSVYNDACDYWRRTRAWNHAYVCNKIFKNTLFDNIRFPKGKLYEDLWIQPELLRKASVIATSSIVGYNYYANDCAISANPSSENLKQCLSAELFVASEMKANWFSEWHLYMCMLYRQVDIYRLSGEIILRWPFVRFICWIHMKTKGRKRQH